MWVTMSGVEQVTRGEGPGSGCDGRDLETNRRGVVLALVLMSFGADDLPDRAAAASAAGSGTAGAPDFRDRPCTLAHDPADGAIGDSVAVADQH